MSNSFIYLVDYIKTKHKITLNKDYANYLLIADLCSEICEYTIVNEIKMLDRNAIIEIDKTSKLLKIDYIDYKENTVEIGSDECFDILDNWYNRWTNIIKKLSLENSNISTDLSGGMDSRLILLLFLGSEIDLNKIKIHSLTDKLSCHAEDFEIASQIADYYKFKLNNNLKIEKSLYSLEDTINISFYAKLCFHKEMYFDGTKNNEVVYRFCGFGGECIRNYRDYWNFETVFDFIKGKQTLASIYPKEVQFDLINSVEKIIHKSIVSIKNKLSFKEFNDSDLLFNLYRETRCRNHYGKANIENFVSNYINLAPLLDPELSKLKLSSNECSDNRLLLSLIFTRYCPNLLNYKFQGKRFIDKKTIEFAKSINANNTFKKNNYRLKKEYKIVKSTDLYLKKNEDEKNIVKRDELSPFDFSLKVFHSGHLKYLFTVYYNPQVIDTIDRDIKKRKYHPLRHAYAIIGITKIINDVLLSESLNSNTVFDINNNFLLKSDKQYCLFDFCDYLQSEIKTKHEQLQQKDIEIQNLRTQTNIQDQVIKQLQNSWSYRIGRLFTYPLSIPLEFYRYIRDYNLIKKSDMFDSEYYLSNNEDVKNAKMDPIKHYLKFGWKEGRNPSEKFDGNEYLNKRPDVRVAGICPLVHYIKFGKDEK